MARETVYYQFCDESYGNVDFYTATTHQPSQDVVHIPLWNRFVKSVMLLFDCFLFVVKLGLKVMAQKVFLLPILKAWAQVSTVAHNLFIRMPKKDAYEIPRRKLPIILVQLERLFSMTQLSTLIYTSVMVMQNAAEVIFQVNEYIYMVICMINDVTKLFLSVFLNVRVVTKNIVLTLSLMDWFTQSIAMLQYFVAVFIYGFASISSFLAKLRQNPI